MRAEGHNPGQSWSTRSPTSSRTSLPSRAIAQQPVRARIRVLHGSSRRAWHHGGALRPDNVPEMVAEAYTNARFRNFLNGIRWRRRVSRCGTRQSFFNRCWVSKMRRANQFDKIMSHHEEMFTGQRYVDDSKATRPPVKRQHLEHDPDGRHVGRMATTESSKSADLIRKTMHDRDRGQRRAHAAASRHDSPTTKRGNLVSILNEQTVQILIGAIGILSLNELQIMLFPWNKWANYPTSGPTWKKPMESNAAYRLSKIIHDSTLYGFHPDLPGDRANEHVAGENVARADRARTDFEALPDEIQAHYKAMKQYYATSSGARLTRSS